VVGHHDRPFRPWTGYGLVLALILVSFIWTAVSESQADQAGRIVVAYEPIWAIGTGRNATPDDANATITAIRGILDEISAGAGSELRVLYGGSVKPGNIAELMAMPAIDGGLVGGASLDPDEFARIVRYSR